MAELQLVSQQQPDDLFDIDELIKDDAEPIIDANDPEIKIMKCLYAIRKIETEVSGFQKNAEGMINEINQWLDNKVEQKEKQIEFLCNQMKSYLKQKNLKSLSLPSGNIGFRKQQDKVEIVDYDKFLWDAEINLINVEPEKFIPNINAIKSKIKETGVIPLGVEVTPQEPKFYYKLNQEIK